MWAKKQIVTSGHPLADYLRQTSKKYEATGRISFENIMQLVTWNPDQLGWRGAYRRCRVDMMVNQTWPAKSLSMAFYHIGHVAVVPDGQLNTSLIKNI